MSGDPLVQKILSEVLRQSDLRTQVNSNKNYDKTGESQSLNNMQKTSLSSLSKPREEVIGCTKDGTIGLVIPNLDEKIKHNLKFENKRMAVGIISSRIGSAAQIMAVDESVKKTNSTVVSIDFARDGKGGTGHGAFVVLSSYDVADVTRAVEIALSYTEEFLKDAIMLSSGSIETYYTARASTALNKAFNAPLDRAFGIIIGAPAGIGMIMGDVAVKSASIDVTYCSGPSVKSAFSNEFWLTATGDSAAVRSALEAAKSVGKQLLEYSQGQS
ncbi:MAG: propanediol utilization microcompartment protein PduB [Bacillota bacterium]